MANVHKENGKLYVTHPWLGSKVQLSPKYGYSSHSCSCNNSKTGLILYPKDIKYTNVVLLVCRTCYDHDSYSGTDHERLEKWYYALYGESKQFELITGFCLKTDGSIGFKSYSKNRDGPYSSKTAADGVMNPFEQDVLKNVVRNKASHYYP